MPTSLDVPYQCQQDKSGGKITSYFTKTSVQASGLSLSR